MGSLIQKWTNEEVLEPCKLVWTQQLNVMHTCLPFEQAEDYGREDSD